MELLRLARSARCLKRCLFDAGVRSRNGLSYSSLSSTSLVKPSMSLSSLSLSVDDDKYLDFNVPGLAMTESDERLSLFANMPPGVKKEHVKASVEETRSLLSIRAQRYDESYYGGKVPREIYRALMGLPDNVQKNTCMIKTEMPQDGMFEVTLPKLNDQEEIKKTNLLTKIYYALRFRFALRFYSSIPSVIMTLARPFVVKHYCANSWDSFTMYRKETAKSLHISLTPGLHKLDSLTGGGGLCISLNMPELVGIEDVKSFFKHDTLFIQGKTITGTDRVRYVTGIRLPESYTRNHSMIKEEMQDGMYKATIPFVTY